MVGEMDMGNAYDYAIGININRYNEKVVKRKLIEAIKTYLGVKENVSSDKD